MLARCASAAAALRPSSAVFSATTSRVAAMCFSSALAASARAECGSPSGALVTDGTAGSLIAQLRGEFAQAFQSIGGNLEACAGGLDESVGRRHRAHQPIGERLAFSRQAARVGSQARNALAVARRA